MTRKELTRRKFTAWLARRRSRFVITIAVLSSVVAAWTIFAHSGALDSFLKQKKKSEQGFSAQSFNSNSPSKEYIYAGGKLVATEEPTGSTGCGAGPGTPGQPTATATSTTSVTISWPASSGSVDHYQVERKQSLSDSGYQVVKDNVPPTSPTVSTTDSQVTASTAYIYRVRAFLDSTGTCPSSYSLIDLATTVDFTTDPPVATGQTIYAVHLTQLRTAVNAVRTTAGQSQFDWGDSSLPVTFAPTTGGTILKDQVQKLRNRLNEARLALGLPRQAYTNEPLTAGTTVFANHILELRQGVQ